MKCKKLYPGCEGCPFLSPGKSLARCPFYLGIDSYSLEEHDAHEKTAQMFEELREKELKRNRRLEILKEISAIK